MSSFKLFVNSDMGTSYAFKCNNCNYSVLTSGKKDIGMRAVTDTYICNSCNEIVDVLVGLHGETFLKEEIWIRKEQDETIDESEFYKCPECDSEDITKWNTTKKPCPKCNGKMKIDKKGEVMMWD